MNEEKETEDISPPEKDEREEGRPPRDPKNGLYTVLSLLIFAVCYIGWQLLTKDLSFTYALYEKDPSPALYTAAMKEIDMQTVPEGWELEYIRLHSGFDSDRLYICFSSETQDTETAVSLIPFEAGDPTEEQRFAVSSTPDTEQRAVYGRLYTDSSNPFRSCIIYEDGEVYALFSTSHHDKGIAGLFESEKIKYETERKRS